MVHKAFGLHAHYVIKSVLAYVLRATNALKFRPVLLFRAWHIFTFIM